MLAEQFPRPGNVNFGCMEIAYGQPDHELVVESRVRQEYLATFVDGIEQSFIGGVDRFVRLSKAGRPAEADDAEGDRRHQLEVVAAIDP